MPRDVNKTNTIEGLAVDQIRSTRQKQQVFWCDIKRSIDNDNDSDTSTNIKIAADDGRNLDECRSCAVEQPGARHLVSCTRDSAMLNVFLLFPGSSDEILLMIVVVINLVH
jgi:hypothetical protein